MSKNIQQHQIINSTNIHKKTQKTTKNCKNVVIYTHSK